MTSLSGPRLDSQVLRSVCRSDVSVLFLISHFLSREINTSLAVTHVNFSLPHFCIIHSTSVAQSHQLLCAGRVCQAVLFTLTWEKLHGHH